MSELSTHLKTVPDKPLGEWAKEFGISRPYLHALLNGQRHPSIDVAKRIAAATDGKIPVTAWPNIRAVVDAAGEAL